MATYQISNINTLTMEIKYTERMISQFLCHDFFVIKTFLDIIYEFIEFSSIINEKKYDLQLSFIFECNLQVLKKLKEIGLLAIFMHIVKLKRLFQRPTTIIPKKIQKYPIINCYSLKLVNISF